MINNNLSNDELFDIIKDHKYKLFISTIKNIQYFDPNIKDNSNTYYIQYAIIFKQLDIIKILLDLGAKIDILDNEGKNILYIPIKFSYNEILEFLFNIKNYVGIPLKDIQDNNNNIALHYTIFFNNKYIFNYLLNKRSDVNQKDIYDNNALHYCVINNNYEFLKIIFETVTNYDINSVNKQGETLLHLAINYENIDIIKLLINHKIDINIYENNNNYIPLIYAIKKNYDLNIIKLFLNEDLNLLIQDNYGNTILHHAIISKNINLIIYLSKFIKNKHIYNLQNIDGMTSTHLLLYFILKNINELDTIPIEVIRKFISKTNLQLQDNEGNTIWHYLVYTNIWYKNSIENILSKKKNNIFIKNRNNQLVYDLIEDKKLINKIIIMSYTHQLKKYPGKWIEKWENECSINDNKCDEFILNNINKGITYPLNKMNRKYCVLDILEGKNIDFITFTGSIIDVIFGLIYLKINYKNIYTSLTRDFKINKELIRYYKEKNQTIRSTEYTNLEILWIYGKLFIPTNLSDQLSEFISSESNFFIIPIGITNSLGGHANIIIIEKNKKIIERFEPNGSDFPISYNYLPKLLDIDLKNYFLNKLNDYNYIIPSDYIPKIGFQQFESIETGKSYKIGDPGGFCLAWCFWYANMRLQYSNISYKKLIIALIRKIREKNLSYKSIIRNYTINITNIRDYILKKIKSNINDYINNQLNNHQLINLEKYIIKLI